MVESLVEFFSLRGAAARGEGVDPAVRARGLGHLRLGRQRDAASRDLWLSGHRAEGLRLALEGLAETARGAALVGLPRDEADGLIGDPTPALDADVAPAHADRYRRVRRVRARLDAALAGFAAHVLARRPDAGQRFHAEVSRAWGVSPPPAWAR